MGTNTKNHVKNPDGFIMPVLLFTVTFIVTMIAIIGSLSLTTYNLASRESYKVNAQMTADAGLDASIHEFNLDDTWLGTGSARNGTGADSEVTLLDTPNLRTTYQTSITDGATTDRKILSVTARSYAPSTATTPKITRRYEVDMQAVTTQTGGPSSVVSGVGGLVLNNNAKITGGDVVVNGTVTVGNNAQIGLSSTPLANAVNVRVAHINCPSPADATYPRTCGPGENGQPITIGNNGKIYADVRATNQTNGANMSNPGLIPNQTVPPIILPDYDRSGHKAAAVTTLPATDNTIACGNNGNKTWPANVKITGDITLGNNCTVTLSGNVWVTGSLIFGNNSKMKVPDAMGTTRPVIMVDGSGGLVIGNNGTVQTNNVGTGIYFIAYWSSACSIAGETPPDCTNLTGTALKNSQNVVKIDLSNNGSAPASILYARWSRARVSNNGAIGAVAGQSIELGNNAVINFSASVPGSANLTTTWVKRGYMRVFN